MITAHPFFKSVIDLFDGFKLIAEQLIPDCCRFRRNDLLKIARLITMIILGDRKAGRLSFLPAFIM
jgi:hypothetical protein